MAPSTALGHPFNVLEVRQDANLAVPRGARIGYVLVAMFTTSVTTALLAYRIKTVMRAAQMNNLKPLHFLTLAVYFLGTLFSISAAICTFGFGFEDWVQCRAAVLICLVFYLGQKLMLYLFLVERTHVIRSRSMPRHKNVIYLIGLFAVIFGFGVVAAISFIWRASEFDPATGQCFIGLERKVALPLLTYDIVVNLALTGVFLYYVRPFMADGFFAFLFNRDSRSTNSTSGQSQGGEIALPQMILKKVIRKTFWGCILIMPSTVTNLSVVAIMNGHQPGWMCLTFCTLDVLWCTIVIHWLTATPEEIAHGGPGTNQSIDQYSRASKLQSQRSYRSQRPIQSVLASGAGRRTSSQTEMVPAGIRCEIEITQDVERVETADVIHDPKSIVRFSTSEL